jgi:hypothetical protein
MHVQRGFLGHLSIMATQRRVERHEEIYGDLKPENYICEIEGEKLFRKVKS